MKSTAHPPVAFSQMSAHRCCRKSTFFAALLLVSVTAWQSLAAQQYNFTHFSEKDGLRNNIIFCFLKDRYGYLWIGTQNGLNRFDGSHFTVFKNNNSDQSIPNNTVHSLCEDKAGNIWGATDNGIFRYSPTDQRFTNYKKPAGATSNNITNILCDAKGDIYTAGIADLMKLNREKNSFEVLTSIIQSPDSLDFFALGKNRLLKDEYKNGLWIATSKGILFYDLGTRQLLQHQNNPEVPLLSYRNTAALARSVNGNIWFYDQSTKSIRLFDPKSFREIQTISLTQPRSDYRVATILEDHTGKLWLSSWNNEFYVLDTKKNNKLERIEVGKDSANTIFFWAAREDENGSIWLGTLNGLSICSPEKYVYKSCQLSSKIPALKNNVILTIEENPSDKSWWLLTANDLIIRYDPATEQHVVYPFQTPELKGISVVSIVSAQIGFLDNNPVIVTPGGLWHLMPGAKQFTPLSLLSKEYPGFTIQHFANADSAVYVTDGRRILKWNRKQKTGEWIFSGESKSLDIEGLKIRNLLWRPGQALAWSYNNHYIGTAIDGRHPNLIKITGADASDSRTYFHYSDIDINGNIWINNKGDGLYRYQPSNGKITRWTSFEGMADNHFHSLTSDNKGNVWMLYFNKATVFNSSSNSFVNFSIPYAESFFNYYNWSTKRADGTVMGSIANEVFEFNSSNLNLTPSITTPHLSAILVNGKEYLITDQHELILEPDQNSLHFRFGFMPDAAIFPHNFEYKLEGIDKEWVKAETINEAVYNNLGPGKYTFHFMVKGQNSAWKSDIIKFTITIKTPFLKSSPFYVLLFFTVFAFLYLFYTNRINQKEKLMLLENKAQQLEKEKAMVMYENLKQQLNPHFLFNSLTSLNSLIETAPKAASAFLDSLSKTYRYILKSRDNETVPLIDEIRFAENYVKLQKTRFEKGLDVTFNIAEEYHHRRIAPVTLQNLIENAIKHNIIDEESPLLVDIFTDGNHLVVRNNLQKKKFVENSNRQGLVSLQSLYSYLSPAPVTIEETGSLFTVKIPLI